MNENLFTDYIFMNMCPLFMVQHIPSCKLQTRPNIQHPCSRKVRRIVQITDGGATPVRQCDKQSPEGATDCQHGMKCHPFGVPFNHNHLCRGLHPCLCSAVPVGDFFNKRYIFIDMRKKQNPQKLLHLWISMSTSFRLRHHNLL